MATDVPQANVHFASNLDGEVPLPPNPPELALLRRLGTGGMGTVYLAVEAQTRRLVAAKLLHAPGDRLAVDRFQTEVRILAELNHTHIVTVFAAHLRHHTPYFTMEYVPGGTLARFVGTHGPFPPRMAATLLAPIARAAHAAHEREIVHRDIKPGNVLLVNSQVQAQEADSNSEGESAPGDSLPTLQAKLSDFGLAKRTDRDEGLTVASGAMGTPGFMAPEQAAGAPVTPRTDVYGLGATLFHALTGRAPFEGTPHEAVYQVQNAEPPRVRSIRPEVPAELEAIVHKCLQRNPADRYASAAELADDLERFATGEPVLAEPPAPVRLVVPPPARRQRFPRATLVACALVALGLGTVFNARPHAEQAHPVPTPLEEMQAKLAAGEPVTLIGPTGEPLWHQWVKGPSGFGPAGNRDQACAFQAIGASMLDLCPDPMTDRYRIRAELCQLDVQGRSQEGLLPTGGDHSFGLYFGRQTLTGNNGWQAENCFVVRFSEVRKGNGPESARFGRVAVVESPGQEASVSGWTLAKAPLAQSCTLPGPWRVIEIEVTPQSVKTWIGSLDTAPLAFKEQNATVLGRTYTAKHPTLDQFAPKNGLTWPAWNPRAALGVWSYRSFIAVRNVTLTPLR